MSEEIGEVGGNNSTLCEIARKSHKIRKQKGNSMTVFRKEQDESLSRILVVVQPNEAMGAS